jgi:hypothetical protein
LIVILPAGIFSNLKFPSKSVATPIFSGVSTQTEAPIAP